ncbi:PH domain-containing protein [Evansella sp. AB-rgal1]|uniref:PH domain-containing protein n=1 Tax=Evansella sp. AB-rgal1 TaxID=3242696 RepID=UPI00359DEC96
MSDWNRQHSTAIFISFLNNLKEMLFTVIAVVIFGQSSQAGGIGYYTVFFSIILILSLASGVIKWLTFKYRLVDNELQIKQGLIFRKNRYIRKERIQSIDINAKVIQRMFQLVELRIETAGGGLEPEFRIVALKRSEAEIIKEELLLNTKDIVLQDEAENQQLVNVDNAEMNKGETENKPDFSWDLSNNRLIIAAITSSGIGIAVTFVAAIMTQLQQLIPEAIYENVLGWIIHSSILYIFFWILAILLIGWIITFISTLLKYGKFRIIKEGNDIQISRGILEQRQLTLSANKITTVRLVQNIFRQPFGYVSVYVESAGGGRKEEDLSTILIPICKKDEVNVLLNDLLPQFVVKRSYESLPKQSIRRYIIKLTFPFIVIAILSSLFAPFGWIAWIFPVIAAGFGFWQYVDAGIGKDEHVIMMKTRAISLQEAIVPKYRIQALNTSQSMLQKMDDLYTIRVSIITSVIGKTFMVRHISRLQMEEILLWFSYEKDTREK